MPAAVRGLEQGPDLEALYRAHAPAVARWVARLGGPGVDLEDVVQEVFLIAGVKLSGFRGDAKVTTWLYRITSNVVRHQRRRARVRRWLSLGEVDEGALTSSAPTPIEGLERRRAERQLYRLLDRLPEKYRTVLILHELEQLSGPEIAELTRVAPSTVWVRLHRARARLAELAQQERLDGPRAMVGAIGAFTLAGLCLAGGAFAGSLAARLMPSSSPPITVSDGQLTVRTGRAPAVVKTPDVVLTIAPEAAIEISIRAHRTEHVESQRGTVQIDPLEPGATVEIESGASWSPAPLHLDLVDPDRLEPSSGGPGRGRLEYVPRAFRELDKE
ncbi:MAG: sigma-70 family RNA polymerase sigma factor [Deltaproteobacteria bacterium]|nr:sigma-70 family RNA polymerase sigma factor [Deltaproteobacteria bacterium]